VSAFVREGAVQRETRLGVDTRLGSRGLKNGHEKILGLRMCNCTGYFTLFTSYAALGVYENRFHNLFLSSSVVKKIKGQWVLGAPPFFESFSPHMEWIHNGPPRLIISIEGADS
jgi:hypothetical protein